MKQFKTILIGILAATLALSSCNKQEMGEVNPDSNRNGVIATFQQPIVEGEAPTKALNNNLEFTFEQNARINVYPGASGECMTYALTPAEGSSATFSVSNFNMKDDTYGAVYPARVPDIDPTQVKFSLAGQNQVANDDASHLSAYDLNYAKAEIKGNTGEFNFAHKVAWLKITATFNSNFTLRRVTISADEGVSNTLILNTLTGDVTATPKFSAEKIVVTLNGEQGVNVTAGTPLIVYATIPAGDYTNLTVSCGATYKRISGVKKREAGHGYQITLDEDLPAVDLGLSVKWAAFNLGAYNPEDYGGYYQWAGLEDVKYSSVDLNWSNCPYHTGSDNNTGWTKYVPSNKASYWFGPTLPDNKTSLDPEDDVAHVMLGGNWRMPTFEEFHELSINTNCSWTVTSINGIMGWKIQSLKDGFTDNWIFLPYAGFLRGNELIGAGAREFCWTSSLVNPPDKAYVNTSAAERYIGCPVRPVME